MTKELLAIERNNAWDLIELLPNKRVVGLKWIFKTIYKSDCEILKHKDRLVDKSYS